MSNYPDDPEAPPIEEFTALELWMLGYALEWLVRHEQFQQRYGRMNQALRELSDKVEAAKLKRAEWELRLAATSQDVTDTPF